VSARRTFRRGAILALVLLAPGLSACGKRGALVPPEGEESAYSYPRFYPAPGTVVPAGPAPAEGVPAAADEPADRPLSPIPTSPNRTRTRTF
jgi:predicted small lipoprotein YifL